MRKRAVKKALQVTNVKPYHCDDGWIALVTPARTERHGGKFRLFRNHQYRRAQP